MQPPLCLTVYTKMSIPLCTLHRCIRLAFLILVTTVATSLVSAHVCMFNPAQRGPFRLDQPGDNTCFHIGPDPCGGQNYTSSVPLVILTVGEDFTVDFQQQLNHWFGPKPGSLRVQIAFTPNPAEADFTYLFGQVIPDMPLRDQIAIQNYTVDGTLPMQTCDHCVMRLTYAPQNPDEPTFHQCADIALVEMEQAEKLSEIALRNPHRPAHHHHRHHYHHHHKSKLYLPSSIAPPAIIPSDCCAWPEFEGTQSLTGSMILPDGSGRVAYSTQHQFIYFSIQDDNSQFEIQHYMNLTAGWEWMWTRASNGTVTCVPTYSDQFQSWCYGAASSMTFTKYVSVSGVANASMWSNNPAGWDWVVNQQAGQCVPMYRVRQETDGDFQLLEYTDMTAGIADPTIFSLPLECPPNPSLEDSDSTFAEMHVGIVKEIRKWVTPYS